VIINDRESIKEAFLRRAVAFADRGDFYVMKNYLHVKWKGKLGWRVRTINLGCTGVNFLPDTVYI